LIEKPERWAIFDHNPATTFYKDRLCLLGDSAHASSPHFGAGAGMAVEDAYVLGNLLGLCNSRQALSDAFTAYDAIRRPRTRRVTQASRTQGRFLDLEEPRQWNGENLDLPAVQKYLMHDVQFIWNEDLLGELTAAKSIFHQLEASRGNTHKMMR
jgi:salicylate hydroxylase